ncbi:MAG: DUF4390 domain-containing protein [Desulfohalobiaceae bacterium]
MPVTIHLPPCRFPANAVHRPLSRLVHVLQRGGVIVAAFLCLLLLPGSGMSQDVRLENLVLDNQSGDMRVRFGLTLQGIDTVSEVLEDGALLGLECYAELYRKRSSLWDEKVAGNQLLHVIKRNPLTKEFLIFPQAGAEPVRGTDLEELLGVVWEKLSINLGPWSRMRQGHVYVLDLKVSITHQEVPAWVRTALFFRSWDVVQESTYRLEFSY